MPMQIPSQPCHPPNPAPIRDSFSPTEHTRKWSFLFPACHLCLFLYLNWNYPFSVPSSPTLPVLSFSLDFTLYTYPTPTPSPSPPTAGPTSAVIQLTRSTHHTPSSLSHSIFHMFLRFSFRIYDMTLHKFYSILFELHEPLQYLMSILAGNEEE
ncbi:hypothetical protein GALMADRAFT_300361 [Galerina marginata CBS 339.88]|uniref:Uncharacterized protein n=1 Tax=Galerina marginata (strain CBS 339.88) TaxID=685588 RepID=A0A067TY46_GALM3|nr:hypothetical protein GALMADRAFT_300361 [Galerina marginata CBS 339.88]